MELVAGKAVTLQTYSECVGELERPGSQKEPLSTPAVKTKPWS